MTYLKSGDRCADCKHCKVCQQIIKKQVANYIQEIKVFIQTDPFLQNASIKSVEATKITKGGLTKAYTLTTNAAHLWQVMLDVIRKKVP